MRRIPMYPNELYITLVDFLRQTLSSVECKNGPGGCFNQPTSPNQN